MFFKGGFSLIEVVIAFAISSIFLSSIYFVLQNALLTSSRDKVEATEVLTLSKINYAFKSRKYKIKENINYKIRGRNEVCEKLLYENLEFLKCPIRVRDEFGREYFMDKEFLIIHGETTLILSK